MEGGDSLTGDLHSRVPSTSPAARRWAEQAAAHAAHGTHRQATRPDQGGMASACDLLPGTVPPTWLCSLPWVGDTLLARALLTLWEHTGGVEGFRGHLDPRPESSG